MSRYEVSDKMIRQKENLVLEQTSFKFDILV